MQDERLAAVCKNEKFPETEHGNHECKEIIPRLKGSREVSAKSRESLHSYRWSLTVLVSGGLLF